MAKGVEENDLDSTKQSSDSTPDHIHVPTKKGRNEIGLGLWTTSFFILGEVAGSGVLALPNAIKGTGYIGILLLIAFCVIATYTGIRLGTCWTIMEERYEEYRVAEIRQPYQSLAIKTYGKYMMWFCNFCIHFTLLGDCVVYTLLMSGMLGELFQDIWPVSICYWAIMVVGIMIPLSWLGTPKDFWQIALIASLTVIVACILITVQSLIDIGSVGDVKFPTPTLKTFSLSFGAILFAYGGATAFPTFQNDMKDRKKFTGAAGIGFTAIICIYLMVACTGYFVYGYTVKDNIALTISDGPLQITSQVLLIIHLFCAFVLVVNPSFQDMEERLNIKAELSFKRCTFRTCVIILILFVAETVPEFSKIQNLIGASGTTLLTFIFPVIFYMRLVKMKNPEWKDRSIPLHETVFMWEIILIGVIGGVTGTLSAVYDIATPGALSLPCYVSLAAPV